MHYRFERASFGERLGNHREVRGLHELIEHTEAIEDRVYATDPSKTSGQVAETNGAAAIAARSPSARATRSCLTVA